MEAERDTKAHVDDAEKKREDAEKAAVCAEDAVETAGKVASTPPSMRKVEEVTIHVEERVENSERCRKRLGEAQQKLNAVEWEKPQIIDKVARVTKSAIQEGMADALGAEGGPTDHEVSEDRGDVSGTVH